MTLYAPDLVRAGRRARAAVTRTRHTPHRGRLAPQMWPEQNKGLGSATIAEPRQEHSKAMAIQGAREHNLKNLSLSIPRNKLVVLTGVSGSGKSTLAFDILFAEGQRRYLESLAPYVRQYVTVL